MNPTIEATEADDIPRNARVCHYDELLDDAKHVLPEAAATGSVDVPWRTAEQFASIDVVKFTAYYRVAIADVPESAERSRIGSTQSDTSPTSHTTQHSGTLDRRTQLNEPRPK